MRYFRIVLYLIAVLGFSNARSDAGVDFFRAVNTDNASTVQALLQQGFDPNTLNPAGQTPLYLAIKDESPKVVAVLLASPQLKPDLANAAGETPLMMAALRGQLEWTQQLAALGAKLNREGWTPLHYAATNGNNEIVKYLVDHAAYIDAESPNGSTPLMMAARGGHIETVKLLLDEGADMRLRNQQGMTVIDFAERYNQPEIASGLKSRWQKLYPQTPMEAPARRKGAN